MKTPVETVVNYILSHPGTHDSELRKNLGIRWFRYEPLIAALGYNIRKESVSVPNGGYRNAIFLTPQNNKKTDTSPDTRPVETYFQIARTSNGYILNTPDATFVFPTRAHCFSKLSDILSLEMPECPALSIQLLLQPQQNITIKTH